jgi:hypothetical protein
MLPAVSTSPNTLILSAWLPAVDWSPWCERMQRGLELSYPLACQYLWLQDPHRLVQLLRPPR